MGVVSRAHSAAAVLDSDDAEEEFDSPETIQALADVLRDSGHQVELLGSGEPLLRRLLSGPRPDLVFNIAEGRGISRSREAWVPSMLEMLGIPYTGSDPLCLAVCLDKECAKRLVAHAGVMTPRWWLVEGLTVELEHQMANATWPLVAKPAFEGSSKGIRATSLVRDADQLRAAVAEMLAVYQQPVLVEEYIDGPELTVGLVGNPPQIIGIMRILPRKSDGPFLYSLDVKRNWQARVRYECPAELLPQASRAVRQAALDCWNALGCRDVARIDFRLRGDIPYFLEANPLPGLAPDTSDLVFLARDMGIHHAELVGRILAAAQKRLGIVNDCRNSA
jgi:D-alanine-D-alanine ligase